ncbi:hypothetical protein BGX31_003403 [Mortierella sp. GBA43]|nr:hypothetical protein BGX31_003403 [Mortierella sp. GBA43]
MSQNAGTSATTQQQTAVPSNPGTLESPPTGNPFPPTFTYTPPQGTSNQFPAYVPRPTTPGPRRETIFGTTPTTRFEPLTPTALPVTFLKVTQPPLFKGNQYEDVEEWATEAKRYLSLHRIQGPLATEAALTLFKDDAREWANDYVEGLTNHRGNIIYPGWNTFLEDLYARYKNPNKEHYARDRLHALKQTTSVARYNTDFLICLRKVKTIDDQDAMYFYMAGLKKYLYDHFAAEMKDHAEYGSRNTQDSRKPPSFKPPFRSQPRPQFQGNRPPWQNQARTSYQAPHRPAPRQDFTRPRPAPPSNPHRGDGIYRKPGPEPMHLDAARMQQKQKDANSNACFYCHKPGHRANVCPEKGKAKSQ